MIRTRCKTISAWIAVLLLCAMVTACGSSGAELVAIHDRPEGSHLGAYHYIIEVEGASDKLVAKLGAMDEVRHLGSFPVMEKQSSPQP